MRGSVETKPYYDSNSSINIVVELGGGVEIDVYEEVVEEYVEEVENYEDVGGVV